MKGWALLELDLEDVLGPGLGVGGDERVKVDLTGNGAFGGIFIPWRWSSSLPPSHTDSTICVQKR